MVCSNHLLLLDSILVGCGNLFIPSRLSNLLAYNCSQYSLMIFCMSVVQIEIFPFLFLILFIWVLSLFSLMSLPRCLSILAFPKKLYWYFIFVLICILFISSLIFIISFLLLTLGFVCSYSNSFRYYTKLLAWNFSCFSRKAFMVMNFPLRTAFAATHAFFFKLFPHCHLYQGTFNFLFDFFIESLIFSSMFFSLHVVCFPHFFPCGSFPVSCHWSQKRYLK